MNKNTLPPAVTVTADTTSTALELTISRDGEGLTLSHIVPALESFGLTVLNETTRRITHAKRVQWVHVMAVTLNGDVPPDRVLPTLCTALADVLNSKADADSLNSLLLTAELSPAAIGLMRALTQYLQQIDRRFDPGFTRRFLRQYTDITRALWTLFDARHNPAHSTTQRDKLAAAAHTEAKHAVAKLPNAELDRMGRTLVQVVMAMLRTNFWQYCATGGALAFKLDSSKVDVIPSPKPYREIFVHSPLVEGVHLRGGPRARGGIRHTDRPTDYRTEVLGLMVTQVRKNTIILPTGSKGGFYIKHPTPADRAAAQAQAREAYAAYVRAMLSITDTLAGDAVVPPRGIIRHDGDDPYFVVAADKGTATFSDLANATAQAADFWDFPKNYKGTGFWLGDAFASGGSNGYDHKGMGITSRGAWISVVHHLKSLGITPSAKTPITMVGIGDMSGDVFGNGLLRTPHAKLLAAFNHKHIFIDPTPDPAASFKERQRLFDAAKGWDDYAEKKISAGGGVYERTAKSIPLSKEAQKMLGLPKDAEPEQVIRAILSMPVDVLWNGGIGTYIKASTESHTDAADRANDDVRVNAKQVQARIIGEGGNLGLTAAARVELALRGCRLNTDALDNSAGVDTSDHEVNLKILLATAMAHGDLSEKQRLAFLPKVEDEIADAVLDDNTLQNMAITLMEAGDESSHRDLYLWQMELLKRGHVDERIDNLPTAETLLARTPRKYVRPEIAALLAGTKIAIRAQLAHSNVCAQPVLHPLAVNYFPPTVRKTFGDMIPHHPLLTDIVAMELTNLLANRCGMLMGMRLQADFACRPDDAIGALVVAIELMDARTLWAMADAAAPTLTTDTQISMYRRIRNTVYVLAGWVLSYGQPVDVPEWINTWGKTCHMHVSKLEPMLPAEAKRGVATRLKEWESQGIPTPLAKQLATCSIASMLPQVVIMAGRAKKPVPKVMERLVEIGHALNIPAVIQRIRTLPMPDKWTRQAVQALNREIFSRQCKLTDVMLDKNHSIAEWMTVCGPSCERYHTLAQEILEHGKVDVAMLTVLVSRMRELER